MNIIVKNISGDLLDLFGNGSLILEIDEVKTIFDTEDSTTYGFGWMVFRTHTQHFMDMIGTDIVILSIDGEIVDENEFNGIITTYNVKIFGKQNIAYDNLNGEYMYFSMIENILKIYHPLSSKWYKVQLEEIEV